MSLIRFLGSSLALSFPVLLRMLPIFLMTGVVVFGAVTGLIKYPGYLAFVAAVVFFPLISFLLICAIRAGLVHRRQSRGPELAQLVRKSLLIGMVQAGLGLFYLVLSVGAVAMTVRPGSLSEWRDLRDQLETAGADGGSQLSAIWALNPPLVFALAGAFAIYSAAYIALSVPFAAHGAAAAVNGPRHEFFYGIGRRFVPLSIVFLIGLVIYYVAPILLSTLIMGSQQVDFVGMAAAGLTSAENIPEAIYLGSTALLNMWLWCWSAAASAVAYIDVREHIEEEHQLAMGAIRASAGPQTDLAELMRERSQRLRGYVPSAVVADDDNDAADDAEESFADMDEPVGPDATVSDRLFEGVAPANEPLPEAPLVLEPAPLSPEEIEERFQSRFGSDAKSSLRNDLSDALREAAVLEAGPEEMIDERRPIEPENLIAAETPAALDSEQVPPVEPDLHEEVPESDDTPEWLRKYMGQDGEKNLFDKDDRDDKGDK